VKYNFKQIVLRLLRLVHLINAAEQAVSLVQRMKHRSLKEKFRMDYPDFSIPPDHLMRDALW
jgi:hypothetical protein